MPSGPLWEAYKSLLTVNGTMYRLVTLPPGAPKEAVNALRQAVVQLNEDKEYIAEAERTMGEAPEYVSESRPQRPGAQGPVDQPRAQDLHGRLCEEGREVTLNPSRVMQEATRSHDFRQSSAAGKFVRRQRCRTHRRPSLSARTRPVRRRCHAAGPAACGHPAQLGRARPHSLDRHRCGTGAARRACGHHGGGHRRRRCRPFRCGRSRCRRSSPTSSRSSRTARSAMSASRSRSSWPTAQAIAEDALELIEVDIEALPAVADRDAARRDKVLLFEADRHQSHQPR